MSRAPRWNPWKSSSAETAELRGRLRWQLTFSHLIAIAFTLVSMIAAVVVVASTWLATQANVSREPTQDAISVGRAIAGMLETGADASQLDPVLHAMANGTLHAVFAVGPGSQGRQGFDAGLSNVAYIVVLGPTGDVLGSSDPSGTAFSPPPPERDEWQALAASQQARASQQANGLVLGAGPIIGSDGQRLGTVIVATNPPSPSLGATDGFGAANLFRSLAIFGAASLAVLSAASIFALVSASLVAYLLSRGLVRRLERLGRAADALASGDTSQRVEDATRDEVGQLARRFNSMAADLERTLGELTAERDRVTGLLDERRQLVANASHELRTPIATLRGYLEAALDHADQVPADLRIDLERMQREVGRLQQLIDDLFALSQAEVGRLSLRIEPTNVGSVVQRLVDTAAPLAWRQRRVEVLAETDGALPRALADAQRLEQVVSNLLSNALRHTPPGGIVAARVAAGPDVVQIEVRDTGEGIGADDLPHVFERFYRVNNGHVNGGGAGLGLALVKELTEAMGGSVSASSTPGEGSCFEVRLRRA